jgi:hypothetical protein
MGALTSKPYAFAARPWELIDLSSFDFFDTIHSPLFLNTRGNELLRILPDLRSSSLNEWISDRARFSYDAVFFANRLSKFSFFYRGCTFAFNPSKAYFNQFLFARFFLSTKCDFDFLGAAQTAFAVSHSQRVGRACPSVLDFRPPAFDLPALKTFSSFFILGLSVRYTHPILLAYMRQLKNSTGALFFDFGESSSLSDYSFGSSIKTFFSFFRYKLRGSVFSKTSCFLLSARFFSQFSNLFATFPKKTVFFESPSDQFFSDLGYPRSAVFHNGGGSQFSVSFTAYKSDSGVDFFVPSAHFYETAFTAYSYFFAKLLRSSSPLPPAAFFYDFSPLVKHKLPATFSAISEVSAVKRYANLYSTYNHYDHYFGHASLKNSGFIILNLRRNEDYRHNHFYYF